MGNTVIPTPFRIHTRAPHLLAQPMETSKTHHVGATKLRVVPQMRVSLRKALVEEGILPHFPQFFATIFATSIRNSPPIQKVLLLGEYPLLSLSCSYVQHPNPPLLTNEKLALDSIA